MSLTAEVTEICQRLQLQRRDMYWLLGLPYCHTVIVNVKNTRGVTCQAPLPALEDSSEVNISIQKYARVSYPISSILLGAVSISAKESRFLKKPLMPLCMSSSL